MNQSQIPIWLSACDILLLANRILPGFENRKRPLHQPHETVRVHGLRKTHNRQRPIHPSRSSGTMIPPSWFHLKTPPAWTKAIRDLLKDPNRADALDPPRAAKPPTAIPGKPAPVPSCAACEKVPSPLKITYISYAPVPSYAAESLQIMKVCEARWKRGHDVRLIAPARRADPALKDVTLPGTTACGAR